MVDKSEDRKDVMEMRRLFWQKFDGKISQAQLDEKLNAIMNRQKKLPAIEEAIEHQNEINKERGFLEPEPEWDLGDWSLDGDAWKRECPRMQALKEENRVKQRDKAIRWGCFCPVNGEWRKPGICDGCDLKCPVSKNEVTA